MFADKGFLSMKPLSSWILDLNARIDFLQGWLDHGKPAAFWMGGMYFPQAFLTGALQNYARKVNVAIDRLDFAFSVEDQIADPADIQEPPEAGVYVYGLYLEGACWDADIHEITDSRPKELYSVLPTMKFSPVIDKEAPQNIYSCPTYKVLSRRGTLSTTGHSTNYVLPLELASSRPQNEWIRAGVAAFLSLKD
jgi:dynein heavy chain